MRQEDKLKEKVGKKIPYRIPEGYFKSFKTGLMGTLPEYPQKSVPQKLSTWQKIRPYVYLAAMFAGIWCMMQIFHQVSTQAESRQQLAAVTDSAIYDTYDPDSYDLYVDETYGNDIEIEDEVTDLYHSMDDFKRDFYACL